ncbi:2-hydroxy-3-keto-5-methylthiopentenyl-1-phosphate phosphatase [Paenisporosarcina sp. TG20]|uniref:2-hydroxy-3-keto-5-methylthiopentenyl-1- phosphate phosphatase n=1 Tax=Paenisporosarcina sp. TG20 TaxID=1211706 RepID=UPI0002E55EB0|nr:2-hydroxy-3-keto-5-methylthiopentenyl-1-phosphate phosphatase [Paenisporosarcina sp. TG20]
MKKPVIFCDFDGTITSKDNIMAIMKEFAPPEWEQIKDQILGQHISIQQGVTQLFNLLSTKQTKQITQFVLDQAQIREGFKDFVAYTKTQNIPLFIVSGGIDFFVKPLLKDTITEDHIYCNIADFSGDTISIIWPHTCDELCSNNCGCCKPSIIRKLSDDNTFKIVIGDSITDLQAATLADKVIARDFLIEKCQELDIPYEPFETFTDVIDILKQLEVHT